MHPSERGKGKRRAQWKKGRICKGFETPYDFLMLSRQLDSCLPLLERAPDGDDKLVLAHTDTDNLMANLRGEVGEVITTWLLMRHFTSGARRVQSGDLGKDLKTKMCSFANLLADKLGDELVGRLSELAENKLGQLNFISRYGS